jgi:hypothetical protein
VCYAAAHPPGTKSSNITIFWCFLVIFITKKVGKRVFALYHHALVCRQSREAAVGC